MTISKMKKKTQICVSMMVMLLSIVGGGCTLPKNELKSPNGKIILAVSVENTDEAGFGTAVFNIAYDGDGPAESILAVDLSR